MRRFRLVTIFRKKLAAIAKNVLKCVDNQDYIANIQERDSNCCMPQVEIHLRSKDLFSEIADRADQVMEQKRLYLDSHLTLEMLAREVWSNRTYLSKALHLRRGLTFRQYICAFRLRHAEQICNRGKLGLEDMAIGSGFGSVRSYNRVADKICPQMDSLFSD